MGLCSGPYYVSSSASSGSLWDCLFAVLPARACHHLDHSLLTTRPVNDSCLSASPPTLADSLVRLPPLDGHPQSGSHRRIVFESDSMASTHQFTHAFLTILSTTLMMPTSDSEMLTTERHRREPSDPTLNLGPPSAHETTPDQKPHKGEQNGCRQRLEGYLSCQQHLALAVA